MKKWIWTYLAAAVGFLMPIWLGNPGLRQLYNPEFAVVTSVLEDRPHYLSIVGCSGCRVSAIPQRCRLRRDPFYFDNVDHQIEARKPY